LGTRDGGDGLRAEEGVGILCDEAARLPPVSDLAVDSKGQGVVIGNESGVMKLSEVGRDIRLSALEERFGQSYKAREEVRKLRPTSARELSDAFDNVRQTKSAADMSYYLYRMGLATRDQVQRSFQARDRAHEKVDEQKPLMERMLKPSPVPTLAGMVRRRHRRGAHARAVLRLAKRPFLEPKCRKRWSLCRPASERQTGRYPLAGVRSKFERGFCARSA